MSTIGVAHVHPTLGFGGTQKSVETMVRYQSDAFEPHVLCLDEPGVRGEALRGDGFAVETVDDVSGVRSYLDAHDVDVVHVHGGFDRGTNVVEVARDLDTPAVLKSLHFGKPDDGEAATAVDRYLYVGKMIFLRYLRLWGHSLDPDDWADQHRLLYNPLDRSQIDPDGTGTYRDRFDIPADAPVVGKIGRSAPEKWGSITIDAFDRIAAERPDVHLLLVNTPRKIRDELESRGHEQVHHVDGVPLGEIDDFHNSVDVLTHASAIGECCPYVLLETMATGTPIVVNSQPMRDNGQVELVDHGVHGYVANGAEAYADATLELLGDPDRRAEMGAAGRDRVAATFDADLIARRLEAIYGEVLLDNDAYDRSELPWWDGPAEVTDMAAFAEEYRSRVGAHYDGASVRHAAERAAWRITTSLPVGRRPAYELARKGFLFADEYF